jgi:hypothetical protein
MQIWFALLAAPILALTDQSVSLAAIGWACDHQNALAVHALHVPFLIATVAGTAMAWQAWRTTTNEGAADESRQRRHFLAGLATGSGALSALVIAAMWAPTWVVSACVR